MERSRRSIFLSLIKTTTDNHWTGLTGFFAQNILLKSFLFLLHTKNILPEHHSDRIWKCFKESQSLAVLRAYGSYQWWIFGIYTVFGSPDGVNGADESESVSYILIQAVFLKYISGSDFIYSDSVSYLLLQAVFIKYISDLQFRRCTDSYLYCRTSSCSRSQQLTRCKRLSRSRLTNQTKQPKPKTKLWD